MTAQTCVMLSTSSSENHRSGFIALIGRPNVGKSTLVNQLVGEKVAITSPVAQTTRNRLRAILTTEDAQMVLVDTPGIHKPHHLLGERLVQSARSAIGEVDLVVLLLEGCERPGRGDAFIVNLLRQQPLPGLVALNKWDKGAGGRQGGAGAGGSFLLHSAGPPAAAGAGGSEQVGQGCGGSTGGVGVGLQRVAQGDGLADSPLQCPVRRGLQRIELGDGGAVAPGPAAVSPGDGL